jgi:hypothetical protein
MRPLLLVPMIGLLLVVSTASVAFAAPADVLAAKPASIDFHFQRVGTENYKRTKITNTSDAPIALLVDGGLPDDFGFGLLPGSTCPVLAREIFAPGDSCYIVVRFSPTEFFAGWHAEGELIATAADPTTGAIVATLIIAVTGTGKL